PSTRAMLSVSAAGKPASCRRWARWAMPTTTRWPRASSPRSNARCLTVGGSKARPKPGWRSSSGSRAGTTRIVVTRVWVTDRRSTTSAHITKQGSGWQSFRHLQQRNRRRVRSRRQHEGKSAGLRHQPVHESGSTPAIHPDDFLTQQQRKTEAEKMLEVLAKQEAQQSSIRDALF